MVVLQVAMLNIDPHLFQPKVIRLQTTESIGHHLMRTTLHSNSQIMTGIANRVQEEANNNILADGEYEGRRQSFHDSESEPPTQWTPEQSEFTPLLP
ncbi:hypothetical protein CDAR_493911 [Caerostris darwini]|uniref:Uncharacterized protein n=1 Tax=Caerostris darwini TaxID=1538125 RepID=A0AAV4VSK4_9ARAC|nr:hypothetical protein CDAR_493911 [Caerostris darwini]